MQPAPGDHGPQIAGIVMCMFALVLVFDLGHLTRRLAQGFSQVARLGRPGELTILWFYKAVGAYGFFIGIHFAIYGTPPGTPF